MSSIENRALPIRTTHISASDRRGGAAIAAFRLHQGLTRLGIDSRMIVAARDSEDETVRVAQPLHTISARLQRRVRSRILDRALARYRATRPSHMDYFSDDRTADPRLLQSALTEADIYHLHWVGGFLDYSTFFSAFLCDKPLVWTLHDMNQFTGGCHYTAGCDKFTRACGACPALGSKNSKDLAYSIFHRKRASYNNLNPALVRIIAPSRWLAGEARRSELFRPFDVETIPYGVDTELFRPRNRMAARELFGIPATSKVVMFVSEWLHIYRKGVDLLIAALKNLELPFEVVLVSLGGGRLALSVPQRYVPLGKLSDERFLSFAYSAADVLVCPTREDNLPNVVLEAMACGTPVAAFEVGGIPDMVRPGVSGILAAPNDVPALREAIRTLLVEGELRSKMARKCRRIAVEEYRLDLQAQRYKEIFDDLLVRSRDFVIRKQKVANRIRKTPTVS